MILINGVKYSCLECVRGHRSSLCRHHMRPLLQVRAKGRPNVLLSTGNKNHRIAVFAEEIASSPEPEGLGCKNNPVVILRASTRHIIDLSNGQIVGPYNEGDEKNLLKKPVIRPESFVHSRSCCTHGVSKARNLCSCNQKRVSKSKILTTYINKKMKAQFKPERILKSEAVKKPGLCCSLTEENQLPQNSCSKPKEEPLKSLGCSKTKVNQGSDLDELMKLKPTSNLEKQATSASQLYEFVLQFMNENDFTGLNATSTLQNHASLQTYGNDYNGQSAGMFMSENGKEVFEVISVPSCSIPGSCCCSSDCQCPNCQVHNNAAQTMPNLEFLNNDAQFNSKLTCNLALQKNQAGILHSQSNYANQHFHSETAQTIPLTNQFAQESGSGSSHFADENGTGNLLSQQNGSASHFTPHKDLHDNTSQDNLPETSGTLSQTLLQDLNLVQQLPQHFIKPEADSYSHFLQQLLNSTSPPDNSEGTPQPEQEDTALCTCPEDGCFCTNCETHGIIEGYKLDDIFFSKVPFDLPFKNNTHT